MQTSYTTSEAMGSVSVCVHISSAQLTRNVSVTLRSVPAGAAVGKPNKLQISTDFICTSYTSYLWLVQSMTKIWKKRKRQPMHIGVARWGILQCGYHQCYELSYVAIIYELSGVRANLILISFSATHAAENLCMIQWFGLPLYGFSLWTPSCLLSLSLSLKFCY